MLILSSLLNQNGICLWTGYIVYPTLLNPNHANPHTKYYIDDLYSMDSLKPTLRKDRTNIIKFIQNSI